MSKLYCVAVKEKRIRERLFSDVKTFDKSNGFAPLPIVMRVVQSLFTPRGWQVYTYILMRTGREGVAWFPQDEMGHHLNFASKSKLRHIVNQLVAAGWIKRSTSKGHDYYIVRDPLEVLVELGANGELKRCIEDIDDLLEMLKQDNLSGRLPPPLPPHAKKHAK